MAGWTFPDSGDLALVRPSKPVENITPAPLATTLPTAGDEDESYGWSANGSLARYSKILPSAQVKVVEVAEGGVAGGETSVHVSTGTKAGFQGGDSGGLLFVNKQLV
ncbi:trypsin-like serine protease [Corynebacterium callunae]|uniref:trypsin-like serine protease n=1 Tax=Corynebacterium callunae TaxID=1721 RepID=UPI003981AE23